MNDTWIKQINPILMTIITILISLMVTTFFRFKKDVNEKLDVLMIQSAIDRTINDNASDNSDLLQLRIDRLETGQVIARRDRITKTEALKAIEKQKIWIEKYFERKE